MAEIYTFVKKVNFGFFGPLFYLNFNLHLQRKQWVNFQNSKASTTSGHQKKSCFSKFYWYWTNQKIYRWKFENFGNPGHHFLIFFIFHQIAKAGMVVLKNVLHIICDKYQWLKILFSNWTSRVHPFFAILKNVIFIYEKMTPFLNGPFSMSFWANNKITQKLIKVKMFSPWLETIPKTTYVNCFIPIYQLCTPFSVCFLQKSRTLDIDFFNFIPLCKIIIIFNHIQKVKNM